MTTNKRMVELDAVLNAIKDKMKELHELRKEPGLLPKDAYTAMMVGVDEIREEIQALPSIPNPIEIIEEAIKETEALGWHDSTPLRELLSKLKS